MQNKRRWLPRWKRIELVELCWSRDSTAPGRGLAPCERLHRAVLGGALPARAAGRPGVGGVGRGPALNASPPALLSSVEAHDRVCEVRTRTGWAPRLIASELGMAHATVSRCLSRRGLSRMPAGEREQVRRFEWPCPGDLLQMDTKRLARFSRPGHRVTGRRSRTSQEKREGVGWEFCHSIIDDHTRLAYTEIHPDEKAPTVTAFVLDFPRFRRHLI